MYQNCAYLYKVHYKFGRIWINSSRLCTKYAYFDRKIKPPPFLTGRSFLFRLPRNGLQGMRGSNGGRGRRQGWEKNPLEHFLNQFHQQNRSNNLVKVNVIFKSLPFNSNYVPGLPAPKMGDDFDRGNTGISIPITLENTVAAFTEDLPLRFGKIIDGIQTVKG